MYEAWQPPLILDTSTHIIVVCCPPQQDLIQINCSRMYISDPREYACWFKKWRKEWTEDWRHEISMERLNERMHACVHACQGKTLNECINVCIHDQLVNGLWHWFGHLAGHLHSCLLCFAVMPQWKQDLPVQFMHYHWQSCFVMQETYWTMAFIDLKGQSFGYWN